MPEDATPQAPPFDLGFADYPAPAGPGPAAGRPRPAPAGDGLDGAKRRVHLRLIDLLSADRFAQLGDDERRAEIRRLVGPLIDSEGLVVSGVERRQLVEDLLDDLLGFGPLEPLLRDPEVSDILVNGPDRIYVERRGVLDEVPVRFRDGAHLEDIIRKMAARVGRRVDESSPIVDARLADGSRINAVLPPLAVHGAALSIRRFGRGPLRMADLVDRKALTPEMARVLDAAVRARQNVIVSGGTGSGKTTLLNALTSSIGDGDRIITIEDTAELRVQKRHVVTLESRAANLEGKGEVSIRDLLKSTLRMRPNRIIVGECRGGEVLDMLQAMNTGHAGSMTTLHANSPREALQRLEMMVLLSGMDLPLPALRDLIGSAVDVIVQADRRPGGARLVTSITEVVGVSDGVVMLQELFRYRPDGVDARGHPVGRFEPTGQRPDFHEAARAEGIELPADLFRRAPVKVG